MKEESYEMRDKIFRLIELAEKALLIILVTGAITLYINSDGSKFLLLIGLAGIALAWLGLAFKPIEIFTSQQDADEYGKRGFIDLLGHILVPKVLWIGSAVSAFGLFSYVADFGNDGYVHGLTNGGLSICISLFVLLAIFLMGVKKLNKLIPILYRAIPTLLLDVFIIFG